MFRCCFALGSVTGFITALASLTHSLICVDVVVVKMLSVMYSVIYISL